MPIIRARPAPRFVVCVIALVAVALVFAGTRAFGFVEWDDQIHVYENRLVLESSPLGEFLRTRTLGYPIPLTVLTYRVEYLLFGLRPAVFHTTRASRSSFASPGSSARARSGRSSPRSSSACIPPWRSR